MLFGMNMMPPIMNVGFLRQCTFCSMTRNFHALSWLLVSSAITNNLSIISATQRFQYFRCYYTISFYMMIQNTSTFNNLSLEFDSKWAITVSIIKSEV
jgi:hypothetical protein